jgi:transposase
MRFVPVKTPEQQAALSVRRTRELFTGQRTQLVNALRSHRAELDLVAEQGRDGLAKLIAIVSEDSCLQSLPTALRPTLQVVSTQLGSLQRQIGELDRMINAQHRASDVSRRLETVPGIGVIGATAISATVIDSSAFNSGRDLAAWIGLVPRQNSTGGKEKLGSISKLGDRYLRRLLVAGATAIVQHAKRYPQKYPWIARLLAKKPVKVVAIAVANKTARVAWANISKGGTYRPPALAAAA